MSIETGFEKLLELQRTEFGLNPNTLNAPASPETLQAIEAMTGYRLPEEIKAFYFWHNGESPENAGRHVCFFGDCFLSAEEIAKDLEFSVSRVKPDERKIDDPDQSELLLDRMADLVKGIVDQELIKGAPKGSGPKWHRVEFDCSPGSCSGFYLYTTEQTADRERGIVEIGDHFEELVKLANELHKMEFAAYNWDELKFKVFQDGSYEVERADFDFGEENFTSTPADAIKKRYFNAGWVPIFSDQSGNYIGVDLDPGMKGKTGQIINFGRDESDMCVLGENLEDFFNHVWKLMQDGNIRAEAKTTHIHDVLRGGLYPKRD